MEDRSAFTGETSRLLSPEAGRAVTAFLHQFGSVLSVITLYPPGHAAVRPAIELFRRRLDALLAVRSPFILSVTPEGLLIEGRLPVPRG